jgi:hypothetical protein
VKEQRGLWLRTVALMLLSAVAAGWSTYLHWLPCRGTMLEGTIIHPRVGDGRSYEEFEKLDPAVKATLLACDRRMDGDQGPWESELNVVALALLGVAWLALVLGLRWQLRTKEVAALPGLATLALAGLVAIGDAASGGDAFIPMIVVWSIELSAAAGLVAILVWQPEVHGRHMRRLLVVLWGTTAFGFIHVMAEYTIMSNFSDRNWDAPPGTGYLTVAVIAVSAILTAIMTFRAPKSGDDDEPHQGHPSGSLSHA